MSRIGKLPINIPTNVNVLLKDQDLKITGPFGELECKLPDFISITQSSNILTITSSKIDRISNALHGLFRALIKNMVKGVSELFVITLLLQGVGYRGIIEKNTLILSLGKFNNNFRFDKLFGVTFFLTRIVYHIFLITMTYNYHILFPILGTLALGLHTYWFKNWITKYTLLLKK